MYNRKQLFPNALWFDLLISSEYKRLSVKPDILCEIVLANLHTTPVIIDEIPLIPDLLDEYSVKKGDSHKQ